MFFYLNPNICLFVCLHLLYLNSCKARAPVPNFANIHAFPLSAFRTNIQVYNSTDSMVVLENVNLSTSGRFRCEVSGEAPSFQTVSDHGDMIVVGTYKVYSMYILQPKRQRVKH